MRSPNVAKELLLDEDPSIYGWGGRTANQGMQLVRELKTRLHNEYYMDVHKYFFDFHPRKRAGELIIFVGVYKKVGPLKLYFTDWDRFQLPVWFLKFCPGFIPNNNDIFDSMKSYFEKQTEKREQKNRALRINRTMNKLRINI